MYSLILHGRRSFMDLQKCRNSRTLVNPFKNASAFSSSFSSDTAVIVSSGDGRKGRSFTVSYLVDSLGLTTKVAESISRKISFEDKVNPDSILSLLRSNGFTDSQISTIIKGYPLLLILDAEKSLGPCLQFLQSRGASGSELTEIVSKVPKILGMKEDRSISVYYDFVKQVIEADKSSKYQKLCHSSAEGSKPENKIRNLSVLRELGVPQRFLFPMLTSNCAHVCGKERFEKTLKKVVEMGFDPTTSRFLDALQVVYSLTDKTIEEKVEVYKRLGLSVEDVWEMFKKWPFCLAHSEKKITQTFETLKKYGLFEDEVLSLFKYLPQRIGTSEQKIENSMETFLDLGFSRDEFTTFVKRFPPCLGLSAVMVKKKTEFLVKKMRWPLKSLVSNPAVLGYSLEKRTIPRCNVIKALMSKGLIGNEPPPIWSVCVTNDQVFLNRYVFKYDDKELVAELMAIFTGMKRITGKVSE